MIFTPGIAWWTLENTRSTAAKLAETKHLRLVVDLVDLTSPSG
jgi:hypothetical protein